MFEQLQPDFNHSIRFRVHGACEIRSGAFGDSVGTNAAVSVRKNQVRQENDTASCETLQLNPSVTLHTWLTGVLLKLKI
jgi:hypothetical protein